MWNPPKKRKWEDGKAKPSRPVEIKKPRTYKYSELQKVRFDEVEIMTRTVDPREFEEMLRYAESHGMSKRDAEEKLLRTLDECDFRRQQFYRPKDFAPAPPENTETKTYLVQFIGGPKNAFQEYHELPYSALKEGRWRWQLESGENYHTAYYELAIIPSSKTPFSDHPILLAVFLP